LGNDTTRVGRTLLDLISWVVPALLLVAALLVGVEAVYVGLIASSDVVAEYHFGSEAMVGHGGWAYRSRLDYLGHGLLWAAGLSGVAVFAAARRDRARST
jgi:hypothetical protein